jgi:terminase small subunit-like protein
MMMGSKIRDDEHAFWQKLILPEEDRRRVITAVGPQGLPLVPVTKRYSDRAVAQTRAGGRCAQGTVAWYTEHDDMIFDFIAGPPECVPDPRLTPKPRRAVGRPTKYSEDVVERFLDCINEGMTVGAALKQEGMPVKQTILNWTRAYPEFRREYDEAIAFRNQCIMDDCVDIADGPQPEGIGTRETRIAARWKLLSGMASHARRKRSDQALADRA